MTMLTSLKALLFPTVAPGGAQAIALPAEGSVDFAQFLGAAQADKPASPPAADDVAAFAARTSATLVGQEYSHGGDKAMAPAGPAMPAPLVEGDAGAQPALLPMPGQGAVPAPIEAAPTASPATAQPSRVPDADGADPEVLKRPHASTDVPEGSPAVVRLPMRPLTCRKDRLRLCGSPCQVKTNRQPSRWADRVRPSPGRGRTGLTRCSLSRMGMGHRLLQGSRHRPTWDRRSRRLRT